MYARIKSSVPKGDATMRVKRVFIAFNVLLIAMLACNMPGSQVNGLEATITAQAALLQAPGNTQSPLATPASIATLLPSDTPLPQNTPLPTDTPLPATPSKPGNFKADGSGTIITFSWNDQSVNETGFRIYQGGVVAPIISVDAHTGTGGMSYNWTGQACGFKATFSIRAFNDAGESAPSKSADGVTVPCQPGNLTANASGYTISFNWSVATQHNEAGFRIYQQGVTAPVATRGPNLGSGGTIFDLKGLLCNVVATYSVTAFNSAGESPPTNLIQSESVPCGPSGLKITSITKDTVQYSWTDNATSETGFHIYRDDALYTTLPVHPGTGTMASDAFQLCDVNFTINHVYSVRAFNYAGESNTSEHVGASTPPCGP
jgi:hypothetical protein